MISTLGYEICAHSCRNRATLPDCWFGTGTSRICPSNVAEGSVLGRSELECRMYERDWNSPATAVIDTAIDSIHCRSASMRSTLLAMRTLTLTTLKGAAKNCHQCGRHGSHVGRPYLSCCNLVRTACRSRWMTLAICADLSASEAQHTWHDRSCRPKRKTSKPPMANTRASENASQRYSKARSLAAHHEASDFRDSSDKSRKLSIWSAASFNALLR